MTKLLLTGILGVLLTGNIIAEETNTSPATPPVSLANLRQRGTNTEPTEIISDTLRVDYASNIGTFNGNVLVTDPRITVRADQIVVFFATNAPATSVTNTTSKTASTNATPHTAKLPGTSAIAGKRSLQKIIADGGVIITQESRKATSDHAEYYADEGRVTLTGTPKVQTPDGNIVGYRITFWYNSERMEVDNNPGETNRTRLVIYPEDIRKNKDSEDILPSPVKP